ncbi:MAG: hypothetical protein NW214_07600 [Pseudanabaenaceae cyanobacterium bins.39]|nr:hypothetical protein [Pseudanabaenaceae cyanobacterium bins.39]
MSVVESSVESPSVPNRDELLAELKIEISRNEANNQRHLTQTLDKCTIYAQAHKLKSLEILIHQELNGYGRQVPAYRNTNLIYFDHGGQQIEGLEQYRRYPIVTGVSKLELHLKNGLTLILPKQILDFLSQQVGKEVATAHVSWQEIQQLLNVVRQEVIAYVKQMPTD